MRAPLLVFAGLAAVSLVASRVDAQNPAPAGPPAPMTFFITSVGKGNGANLGGLAGADAHCAALADAVGAKLPAGRAWHAYLSAVGT
ncbi:MAG: lectin, partial [bacterium]